MLKKLCGVLCACALLLSSSDFAFVGAQQQQSQPSGNDAQAANRAQTEFDAARRQGLSALYDLDYATARKQFDTLNRLQPDSPAGNYYLAATVWLEEMSRLRLLNSSIYNDDTFYEKAAEKADPARVARFRELLRQSRALAKARLDKNNQDADALYFSGVADGISAAAAVTIDRSIVAAARDGSQSVETHRNLLKVDPKYIDAEFTVGMSDYIIPQLPLAVKILTTLSGVSGSKRRGIETLERVTREGRFARNDAKAMLTSIYKRERRWTDAVRVTRELAADFPRNYWLRLEAADALIASSADARRAANQTSPTSTNTADAQTSAASNAPANVPASAQSLEREAFAIFDSLLQEPARVGNTGRNARANAGQTSSASTAVTDVPRDLVFSRYGEALMVLGDYASAVKQFGAAAEVRGVEQKFANYNRLRRAQALDLAGQREQAVVQYKQVLTQPDAAGAHEQARRGLERAYQFGK